MLNSDFLVQVLHVGDIICEGFVRPLKTDAKAATPATADKEEESEWSFGETETVPSLHFYNAVSRMGLCYGPQFRMVQRLNTAADTEAQLRYFSQWQSFPGLIVWHVTEGIMHFTACTALCSICPARS